MSMLKVKHVTQVETSRVMISDACTTK